MCLCVFVSTVFCACVHLFVRVCDTLCVCDNACDSFVRLAAVLHLYVIVLAVFMLLFMRERV